MPSYPFLHAVDTHVLRLSPTLYKHICCRSIVKYCDKEIVGIRRIIWVNDGPTKKFLDSAPIPVPLHFLNLSTNVHFFLGGGGLSETMKYTDRQNDKTAAAHYRPALLFVVHFSVHTILNIIIIIIYLSWSWATCWPVPVSRVQKSLQRSAMIPSASWGTVFHYPG